MRNALSPQAMVALIRSNTFITLRNLLQVSSPEGVSLVPISEPAQPSYLPRQTSFRLNISLRLVLRYASQIPFRFAWWRSAQASSRPGFGGVSQPGVRDGWILAKMITYRNGAGPAAKERGATVYWVQTALGEDIPEL